MFRFAITLFAFISSNAYPALCPEDLIAAYLNLDSHAARNDAPEFGGEGGFCGPICVVNNVSAIGALLGITPIADPNGEAKRLLEKFVNEKGNMFSPQVAAMWQATAEHHLVGYDVSVQGLLFPHGHIYSLFHRPPFTFMAEIRADALRNSGDPINGLTTRLLTVTLSLNGQAFTNHQLGILDVEFDDQRKALLVFDTREAPRMYELPFASRSSDDYVFALPEDFPTTREVRRQLGPGELTARAVDVIQMTVRKK